MEGIHDQEGTQVDVDAYDDEGSGGNQPGGLSARAVARAHGRTQQPPIHTPQDPSTEMEPDGGRLRADPEKIQDDPENGVHEEERERDQDPESFRKCGRREVFLSRETLLVFGANPVILSTFPKQGEVSETRQRLEIQTLRFTEHDRLDHATIVRLTFDLHLLITPPWMSTAFRRQQLRIITRRQLVQDSMDLFAWIGLGVPLQEDRLRHD